jgi:hypothetical protein
MNGWRDRFVAGWRNAFDLGPKGPVEPTPQQRETIERLLGAVVKRGLTTPTILFLESTRSLNAIGSSAITFFEPIASTIIDRDALREVAAYLENRGSIAWMVARLEQLESERGAS